MWEKDTDLEQCLVEVLVESSWLHSKTRILEFRDVRQKLDVLIHETDRIENYTETGLEQRVIDVMTDSSWLFSKTRNLEYCNVV